MEKKNICLTEKDQLKRALISEDDTMNYSYFEGKKGRSDRNYRTC